jgi:alkylation response protein AidB-like acyl-CoA dehydrogenase
LPILGEQGIIGCRVSEEYGGAQLDAVVQHRLIAAIAQADASIATMLAFLNGFVIEHLIMWATSEQQQQILPNLLDGQQWATWASPPPARFVDLPQAPDVLANTHPDGWQLNGELRFVPMGATAKWLLVFASDAQDQRHAFWLEANTPGIERQVVRGKLGLRHSDFAHVRLHNAEVPNTARIGREGDQRKMERATWRRGRVCLASVALGIAEAAHREACTYAMQRRQFGRPIGDFQAIQWKIADVAMKIEASRLLTDRAAWSWQQCDEIQLEIWSHAARMYTGQTAVNSAAEAIQIHGGYGYTVEYPVERFYRDAQSLRAQWNEQSIAHTHLAADQMYRQF